MDIDYNLSNGCDKSDNLYFTLERIQLLKPILYNNSKKVGTLTIPCDPDGFWSALALNAPCNMLVRIAYYYFPISDKESMDEERFLVKA